MAGVFVVVTAAAQHRRQFVDSQLGQRPSRRDTLIGSSPRAVKRHGVQLRPRATDASGQTFSFADETELSVGAVIWATGFGLDHNWIDLPVFESQGEVGHERGVTAIPGLYFLGLPWQHTRGSALLGWVKEDAKYLAHQISNYQRSPNQRSAPMTPDSSESSGPAGGPVSCSID